VDAHTLRVRAPESEYFFDGVGGQTLLEVMGIDRRPERADTFDAGLFRVEIIEADASGVKELEFTFDKPLKTAGYHFYVGSPHFLAYPLDVGEPVEP